MSTYRYRIVDVFTTRQFEGNPLAVFPNAEGLDRATMQRIARELNLSETVFIFPPARLRIFTPLIELDFAGHPTIGAGFVMLDEKIAVPKDGRFVVEENVGSVPIRVDGAMLWLTTPPIRDGRIFDRAACANALGLPLSDLIEIEPQLLDAGNPTFSSTTKRP